MIAPIDPAEKQTRGCFLCDPPPPQSRVPRIVVRKGINTQEPDRETLEGKKNPALQLQPLSDSGAE